MTNDTEQPDIAKIRQLLLAAFTPEDLRRFCEDRPDLRPVVRRFSPRHSVEDMADDLISYCRNFRFFPELLAEVKQVRPRQYEHIMEPDQAPDRPSLLTSELLTISRPIALLFVRVPAGEFLMGSVMARDKDAQEDELPPHPVHLPEFYIGRYPVTNRQYRAFVQATGHRTPYHWEEGKIPQGKQNHPVVSVSRHQAVDFCDWLSHETKQPFRLPTEAEWEKAARGADGRIYPWGDDPPDENRCNFGKKVGDTTTIGRYSPQGDSPYGCAGMAGNVWEWCQSLHEPYPYQADDGREDLQASGPRVLRGGSWWAKPEQVRCASRFRINPGDGYYDYGFRVARGPLG